MDPADRADRVVHRGVFDRRRSAPRHCDRVLLYFRIVNRRDFVTTAVGSLAAAKRVLGANDRIRVGLIGNGGRCNLLATHLGAIPGHEVVLTADVYQPRREAMATKMGAPAKPVRGSAQRDVHLSKRCAGCDPAF